MGFCVLDLSGIRLSSEMQFLDPLFSGSQESTGDDKRIADDWMTCALCV